MRIVIAKVAGRALRRSHKRALLVRKLEELAADRDAHSANVKKLQGKAGFRLRVQDWRIVFRIEDEVMFIDEIEPRGSIYEDRK